MNHLATGFVTAEPAEEGHRSKDSPQRREQEYSAEESTKEINRY